MIGTITRILALSGIHAANGAASDEVRRLEGMDFPAAYVSYEPRLLSSPGWYGYRIAFKASAQDMERAMRAMRDIFEMRDGYEYSNNGVYVFAMLFRFADKHYGIGGGSQPASNDWLWFMMPYGGKLKLHRNGNPTVVTLEYSTDEGATWTEWQEDGNNERVMDFTSEMKMYIRNTSETTTGFTIDSLNNYYFLANYDVEAGGNLCYLVSKNPSDGISIPDYAFYNLMSNSGFNSHLKSAPDVIAYVAGKHSLHCTFKDCTALINPPSVSIERVDEHSCEETFRGCTSLVSTPELKPLVLSDSSYYRMFHGCSSLKKVVTKMTDISGTNCLYQWLRDVAATGEFYCPSSLVIPSGASGIPSGWTRIEI